MTAPRRSVERVSLAAVAAAMMLSVVPAMAQNADAPIDVTAAPPPAAGDIGPSQLRDFNLNGTVTRPADRPAATQPAPARPAPNASQVAPSATTTDPAAARTPTRGTSAANELPAARTAPPVTLPDAS